jgi:hypothetical protein
MGSQQKGGGERKSITASIREQNGDMKSKDSLVGRRCGLTISNGLAIGSGVWETTAEKRNQRDARTFDL